MNAYSLLGVDPSAPDELVNIAYWAAAADLQQRRSNGESVDAVLYAVTRSYELISNPGARADYDASIGLHVSPVIARPLSQVRPSLLGRLLRGRVAGHTVDCYEVIGLDPAAPDKILLEAYQIMRDQYLRAPDSRRRLHLVSLLDEAYAVLSDRVERSRYDAQRVGRASSRPADRKVSSSPEGADKQDEQETRDEVSARSRKTDAGVGPASNAAPTSKEPDARKARRGRTIATVRHASVSAWNVARTNLRVPRVTFSRKPPAAKNIDEERRGNAPVDSKTARPAPYKAADAEEAFLGRLASRVHEDSHPDDSDSVT